MNSNEIQDGGIASTFEWGSLGKLVQLRTLKAVSEHFFHMGVAELCMDVVKRKEKREECAGAGHGPERPRELKFAARTTACDGEAGSNE